MDATKQFSGGGVDRFALALPGFLQVATTRQQWSRMAQLGQGRARRNVEDRWNKSVAWGTYRWPRSSEDDWAGQHGGDGDSDGEGRREKYNLLYEGFPKLGALHTLVLVCFAQGVGRYI